MIRPFLARVTAVMTRAIMHLYRARCANWGGFQNSGRCVYTRDEIRAGSIYSAESREVKD